jgi:hypothetical protein
MAKKVKVAIYTLNIIIEDAKDDADAEKKADKVIDSLSAEELQLQLQFAKVVEIGLLDDEK